MKKKIVRLTEQDVETLVKKILKEDIKNFTGDIQRVPGKNELRLVKNEIEDLNPNFTMMFDALKVRSKGLEISYDVDSGIYTVISDNNGKKFYNKIQYPKCSDCEFRDPKHVVQFIKNY
jgi:hypothetical protein